MRTDGLAHRLNAAVGLGALLLLSGCQAKSTVTAPVANLAQLESSTLVAARALERYYQAENDGAVDAYRERARRRGVSTGLAERCRLPTGATSSRPSVLANPPIAASSIRQRGALVAAVGTYIAALAAVADRSSADVLSAALSNFASRTLALQKAADEHNAGDLFIDEAASALAKAAARLQAGEPGLVASFEEIDPVVRRSIAILASDAARQRVATVDATKLAYDSWLENRNHPAARAATSELPSCSEPAIFARTPARNDDISAAGSDPHGMRLRERANAARAADPTLVLHALVAVDDAELRFLENPADVAAAEKAATGSDVLARAAAAFDEAAPR